MSVTHTVCAYSVGLASNNIVTSLGCRSEMTALPEHLSSKAWGQTTFDIDLAVAIRLTYGH